MTKGRNGGDDLSALLAESLSPVDEPAQAEAPVPAPIPVVAAPVPTPEVADVPAPPAPTYSGMTTNLAARVPIELKADFDAHLVKVWQETKGRKVTVQDALPALVQMLLEDPEVEAKWRTRLGR